MKKLFATLFICGTIFLQSVGQISVNILPTYNIIKSDFTTAGFGIETGVRFRSSKIFLIGFDAGYHLGKLRTPQTVTSFGGVPFTYYSGEHSYIPVQGILELQSINHKIQFLGGLGLGMALWNASSVETSVLTSYHLGFSYRLNDKMRILAKMKQNIRVFLPRKQDVSGSFTSSNISLGINY